MNESHVELSGLRIASSLAKLVNETIAPGTGIASQHFWAELADIVREFGPRNAQLLERRDELQAAIDDWILQAREAGPIDVAEQKQFLKKIGYLVPDSGDVRITTAGVDPEIAVLAGPQLVVPIDNARYVLNAANARWGSLYDALYGTDVIAEAPGAEKAAGYNPGRGQLVVAKAASILDDIAPLACGSHANCSSYAVSQGGLQVTLSDGTVTTLASPPQFVGIARRNDEVTGILLRNNGLHLEIQIDPASTVGQAHPAGVKDILIESALSVIADCEDSVAAVDAEDKTRVYGNWLGLMNGTLEATLQKGQHNITRKLAPDREYETPTGDTFLLPGRAVLMTRNVGAHIYTDAVTTADGKSIPETFLDAMVCAFAAKHDLQNAGRQRNSRSGSIYFVKPKQHGPDEVTLAVELFARVERALSLTPLTIKIGIMDEERRTTVNLKACLKVASDRVIFINTGFLDRTGDEIHTMMELGPVTPKNDIKNAPWMLAYEDWNVDIGLAAGMRGHGQIGKGMWAIPDEMAQMLKTKIAHPLAGANTAWVPSPTAATLHALHYHQVNVAERQKQLSHRPCASLDDILTMPLYTGADLSPQQIQMELDNNVQGILGYVVRWVEQGVGCSKVPDINDVGLMEDRATLRISSQHIANWLHHGVVSGNQIVATFKRMAPIVDQQNAGDPAYRNMAPDFEQSIAFQAALELVMTGREQANGYTEPVLHRRRREFKARG